MKKNLLMMAFILSLLQATLVYSQTHHASNVSTSSTPGAQPLGWDNTGNSNDLDIVNNFSSQRINFSTYNGSLYQRMAIKSTGEVSIGQSYTTTGNDVLDIQPNSGTYPCTGYGLSGATVLHNYGTNNIFVGHLAGAFVNTSVSNSTYLGYNAGNTTGSGGRDNTLIGYNVAPGITNSRFHTFVGSEAGFSQTGSGSGHDRGGNVFVGLQSGYNNDGITTFSTEGLFNAFLGIRSGYSNTIGGYNTILGADADVAQVGLFNASAIGANAIVVNDNQMILGGIFTDASTPSPTYHSTFVGIGLSGDVNGPQNSLEINADPARGSDVTASGLRFTQVTSQTIWPYSAGNNDFGQAPNATTIQAWGKVLTVNETGDVGLTDALGSFGLCANTATIPLPQLSGNVGLQMFDASLNPYNIYYEGQDLGINTNTPNANTPFTNINTSIGLGFACSSLLPGKFSVEQLVPNVNVTVPTLAGYFHNGDQAQEAPAFDKTGLYGISDGIYTSSEEGGWNIGGDFEGLNCALFNIGVRGRAGRNNSIGGNTAWGGVFEATDANESANYGISALANSAGANIGARMDATGGLMARGIESIASGSSVENTGAAMIADGSSGTTASGLVAIAHNGTDVTGVIGLAYDGTNSNIGVYAVSGGGSATTMNYGLYAESPVPSATSYTCTSGPWLCDNAAGFFNGFAFSTQGFVNLSDAQFKENIQPLDHAMDLIMRLNPKSYSFKNSQYPRIHMSKGIQQGLMAQDVELVLPQLIRNVTVPPPLDSTGHFDKSVAPIDAKAIDYQGFIPYLIQGMKEQQQIIDSVKEENQQQQQTIDDLNSRLTQLEGIVSGCCTGGRTGSNPSGPTSPNNSPVQAIEVQLSNENSIILNQNDPNPFTESTTISFSIPTDVKEAKIIFFDNLGRVLKTVVVSERGSGALNVFASNLSAGIYSYSLLTDGNVVSTKKMVKN